MDQKFFGFFGAYGNANGVRDIVRAHKPCKVVTLKIESYKLGFGFAKKAFFANRFNDANTVAGVKYAVALIYGDEIFPCLIKDNVRF